ncbi:hypothetical protein KIN20_018931 [Parelaphostrongylus tenuis]|uniref:Metalloendopeptidase n=1 Tax=Parelaphostrongylus tenuis TaxID=148309 RepID=A0AAD5N1N6_PARTN|nr:hypothetical protein KIN20_018931 [Parelaphostrongylus tenuis]
MSLPPQKRRHLAIKWRFATLRLLIRKRFRILLPLNKFCYDDLLSAHEGSITSSIIIDQSRCVTDQIVQHEMLHIIGLYHEHNRYDRDKYIKVHYENVLPGRGGAGHVTSSWWLSFVSTFNRGMKP